MFANGGALAQPRLSAHTHGKRQALHRPLGRNPHDLCREAIGHLVLGPAERRGPGFAFAQRRPNLWRCVAYMRACMQTSVSGLNEVNCIGRNGFGELGYPPSLGPASVIFGSMFGRPVGAPSSGGTFTCVDRLSDGSVDCAGQNVHGMLGNGNNSDSGVPQVVDSGKKLAGVAAGWMHACALAPSSKPGAGVTTASDSWAAETEVSPVSGTLFQSRHARPC